MAAHLLQRPPRLAEQRDRVRAVHGRGRVAEQRLVRHRRAGVQRVGVGQPLLLRAQRGLFAGLRLELLDLGEAGPEGFGLRRAGPRLRGQRHELLVHRPVPLERPLVVAEHHGKLGARVLVERLALPAWLEQLLLVGLAVHGDQVVGQVREQRHRHGAAAGERPGPALGRYRPGQHQRAVLVEFAAGLLDLPGDLAGRLGAEPALHGGALLAGPDPRRVRAAAEQQAEPGHHHRLARAGLAGQRGETGRQLEQRVVDDPEPGDAHFLKHDRQQSPSYPASPRRAVRTWPPAGR